MSEPEKIEKEENLGLIYAEYKARIVQRDKSGNMISIFTTWREDFISKMIEGSNLSFTKGEKFHIEIVPETEDFQHISDDLDI